MVSTVFSGFVGDRSVWGTLALGMAAMLAAGTIISLGRRANWSWKGLKAQPAATWGFGVGHMGMAVIAAGITFMSVWASDDTARINVGDTISVKSYSFTLKDVEEAGRDNYAYQRAIFDVTDDGKPVKTLSSERRFYPVRSMYTTEAGFRLAPFNTIFVSLSEGSPADGWIVRAYHHPGVVWIWIGALMMALAGFISLFDRRLRFRADDSS